MLKPKFVLKEPGSTELTLIYLFVNFSKQRVKISTRLHIEPAEWNAAEQKGMGKKHAGLNAILTKLAAFVQHDAFAKLTANDGQLTADRLKEELDRKITGKVAPAAKLTTLADFADELTQDPDSKRAANTLQVYRSTIMHLRDYEKKTRHKYRFEDIDLTFYNGFTSYLENTKGHSTNTVGKIVKTIKSFMNAAAERKKHTHTDHKLKSFKVITEKTDAVYLSVEELTTLAQLDIKPGPLADVRDIFILGSFTGLRFSDLSNLSNYSISGPAGEKRLKTRAIKTGIDVEVPLHPLAEEVIDRNGGKPPKVYSNPATNRLLKDLAKLAGFTEKKEVYLSTGRQVKEKWELVTTHTAHRSAATNMYHSGIPVPKIMELTGHKKLQTFLLYIKSSAQEKANDLSTYSFFRK